MNGPKAINEKEAAARYSLGSFIRGSAEKFTTSQLLGIRRMPVSSRTGARRLSTCQHLLFAFAVPVAAVSGAVVATYSLGSCVKYTPTLFFCAVVLSNWLGGVGAEIFSIVLSVVALDYYFIPPIYALGLSLEETPDMILFVTAGLFVNWANREGSQVKKPIERHRKRLAFREKHHERTKANDLLQVDRSRVELADWESERETSGSKDTRKLSGTCNLIVTKVEADKEVRHKLSTGKPRPDKTRVVSVNGFCKPLRNPPTRRSGRACVFCKHGDYWTIQYQGRTTWLKATRGLDCLACLLANPGREFHVIELMTPPAPATELNKWRVQEDGYQMTAVRLQDTSPILDALAKAEYKRRLAELRAELHAVECFNDPGRTEAIQQERDAIAEQLAAAVGLGGRDRKTGSQAERARTAVTKRIRGSIKRIVEATPSLEHHLASSIKTG
jgi:hypothetical protein